MSIIHCVRGTSLKRSKTSHHQQGSGLLGDSAVEKWQAAITKAAQDYAISIQKMVDDKLVNTPLLDDQKQFAHTRVYNGAYADALKQLQEKYPKPSAFQSTIAQFSSIPGLSLIPGFGAITGLLGMAGNALHI